MGRHMQQAVFGGPGKGIGQATKCFCRWGVIYLAWLCSTEQTSIRTPIPRRGEIPIDRGPAPATAFVRLF